VTAVCLRVWADSSRLASVARRRVTNSMARAVMAFPARDNHKALVTAAAPPASAKSASWPRPDLGPLVERGATDAVEGDLPVGVTLARAHPKPPELESAGYRMENLEACVEAASQASKPIQQVTKAQARRLVDQVLDPEGNLATRKVFAQKDVIVEMAPHLYGQELAILAPLVSRTLADPEAIPLIGVKGARDQVYSTAHVLATEAAIAAMLATQLQRSAAPVIPIPAVRVAQQGSGQRLSADQMQAISAICTSGRGAELVVGVAGSGKTTMLAVVRAAFQEAGYEVPGTATSGQAARNLGRKAGIASSRTLASLTWRLDHGQAHLSEQSLVICDEVGMTEDIDLARLLAHVEAAGAKLVLLGDPLQLGPVGPGGALGALVARHPGAVHRLEHNLRQVDPAEAQALAALRAGNLDQALSWYLEQGRIRVAPTRDEALQGAVVCVEPEAQAVVLRMDDQVVVRLSGQDISASAWPMAMPPPFTAARGPPSSVPCLRRRRRPGAGICGHEQSQAVVPCLPGGRRPGPGGRGPPTGLGTPAPAHLGHRHRPTVAGQPHHGDPGRPGRGRQGAPGCPGPCPPPDDLGRPDGRRPARSPPGPGPGQGRPGRGAEGQGRPQGRPGRLPAHRSRPSSPGADPGHAGRRNAEARLSWTQGLWARHQVAKEITSSSEEKPRPGRAGRPTAPRRPPVWRPRSPGTSAPLRTCRPTRSVAPSLWRRTTAASTNWAKPSGATEKVSTPTETAWTTYRAPTWPARSPSAPASHPDRNTTTDTPSGPPEASGTTVDDEKSGRTRWAILCSGRQGCRNLEEDGDGRQHRPLTKQKRGP